MKKAWNRSFEISKTAFRILRKNPQLMVFPVAGNLVVLAMIAAFSIFFVSILMQGQFLVERETGWPTLMGWAAEALWLFLLYFIAYVVLVFSEVALTHMLLRVLRGQGVTLVETLRFTCSRASSIAGYAAIASTMGTVLNIFPGRWLKIFQIPLAFVGVVWSVAVYLVIPVLVQEKRGVLDSILRSEKLFRQTWKESLAWEFGLAFLWIPLGVLLIGGLWIASLFLHSFVFVNVAFLSLIACIALISVVGGALRALFRSALYVYTVEGVVPVEFSGPAFDDIWKVK